MKKTFLIAALVTGFCVTVSSQNAEKALKANKWQANAELGAEHITLSKTAGSNDGFETKFNHNGSMDHCAIVKSAFLDPQGKEVSAGTKYCDTQYTYEVKGDILHVKYPLVDWFYKVKVNNGNIELTSAPNQH